MSKKYVFHLLVNARGDWTTRHTSQPKRFFCSVAVLKQQKAAEKFEK